MGLTGLLTLGSFDSQCHLVLPDYFVCGDVRFELTLSGAVVDSLLVAGVAGQLLRDVPNDA